MMNFHYNPNPQSKSPIPITNPYSNPNHKYPNPTPKSQSLVKISNPDTQSLIPIQIKILIPYSQFPK